MRRNSMLSPKQCYLAATACFVTAVVMSDASAQTSNAARKPESSMVSFPQEGAEAQVEVGESMIGKIRRTVVPTLIIQEAITHKGSTYTLTIPAGELVWLGVGRGASFYRIQGKSVLTTFGVSQPDKITGIFVPDDPAASPGIFWDWPSPLKDKHPGIEMKYSQKEIFGADSFKRELVYAGAFQNVLSLLYREFKDDFARPAFSQELKYDLAQGRTIGYRGARFEVVEVSNTGMRFKVLKALE